MHFTYRNLVEEWLEHYRIQLHLRSPYVADMDEAPLTPRERKVKSAAAGGGIVIIERESTAVPRFKLLIRPRSAVVSKIR